MMKTGNVHRSLIDSVTIRFNELSGYLVPNELPLQSVPVLREYDMFFDICVNEEGADALLLFFYGLRNNFFHGDNKATFEEGSMKFFREKFDAANLHLSAIREHSELSTIPFWTTMLRLLVSSLLVGRSKVSSRQKPSVP